MKAQFAPEGATWHYGEAFAFMGDKSYMTFVAEGDTIIQGITCQKIKKYGKVGCLGRPSMEFTYEENGIVYYYNPHHEEFEILYDFTAETGDTWTIFTHESSGDQNVITVRVDSFDFVTINGIALKRIYALYEYEFAGWGGSDYSNPTVLIERLGDIYYMFNLHTLSYMVCDGNYSTGLRCYEDEEFELYDTGIADSCTYSYIWVGVSDINKIDRVKIFPNPISDRILIESDLATEPKKYIIRDLSGKLVQQGLIINNEIHLRNASTGIYLLEFYSDGDLLLSLNKLVKI